MTSETESSEIVTYAALQAYTYDADGYGAEEISDDKEEVEVEGMTVTAKRGRTKMLSELAQVAPALWGAGPTMLQTSQVSTIAKATISRISNLSDFGELCNQHAGRNAALNWRFVSV